MKRSLTILCVSAMVLVWHFNAQGQNQHITQTNRPYLLQKAIEWNNSFQMNKLRAVSFALEKGLPTRIELEGGQIAEITEINQFGSPEYFITQNLIAAQTLRTNRLWSGGTLGLDLNGQDMFIGEWDGGAVRATHQEYNGRVTQGDSPSEISSHATHVAGTLIASGVDNESKGMAHQALLHAYDWNSHTSEMALEAANGLLISNHSYGNIAGWINGNFGAPHSGNQRYWWGDEPIDSLTDWRFGYYDGTSAAWDDLAYNAPYYLIVKSAGNDRNDVQSNPYWFRNYDLNPNGWEWDQSSKVRNSDGPYDCLPTYSCAKNILTIGAVNSGFSMSTFSSWGPTDDGRIKPDVVGDGVGLRSSTSASDTSYGSSSGTSMSGPNVAGSALLLQQHAMNTFGEYMRSATLKGLIIHTATDLGNPGPDYSFGWGVMNTEEAISFMDFALPEQFVESSLGNGETYEYSFAYHGSGPLKFTLSWTDPAGTLHEPELNNPELKLVNDLDLLLTNNSTQATYEPYILDPENPSLDATTGDNFRDNVEMIETGVLPPGNYTLTVSHKGSLSGGAQDFSLLSSGPITPLSLAFLNLRAEEREGTGYLQWETEPARLGDRFIVEKSRDGQVFVALDTVYPELYASSFDCVDKHLSGSPIWYYRIRSVDALDVSNLSFIVHIRPQEAMSQILVYPNPGVATCYIEANRALKSISVMDTFGKIIWYEDAADTNRSSGRHFELNAIDWISGLYIIEAIDNSGQRSQVKWLKSR